MLPEQNLGVHTQHVPSSLRTEDSGLSLYQSYPGTYSLCQVRQPGLLGARHALHTHGFHTCIGSTWHCLQPPVPTSSGTLPCVVFSSPMWVLKRGVFTWPHLDLQYLSPKWQYSDHAVSLENDTAIGAEEETLVNESSSSFKARTPYAICLLRKGKWVTFDKAHMEPWNSVELRNNATLIAKHREVKYF